MLLSGRTALGLLFLGIGALLLRETYAVDVGAFAVPGEMGTMTYPRILLFGWIGLSILYLLRPARRGADVAGVREDSGRRRPAALLGRPVLTLGRTVCFPISCTAS